MIKKYSYERRQVYKPPRAQIKIKGSPNTYSVSNIKIYFPLLRFSTIASDVY